MDVVKISVFNKQIHDRSSFDCGIEVLNEYCKTKLGVQQKLGLSVAYVAAYETHPTPSKILGYYTISTSQLAFERMPIESVKRVPQTYPIPTMRIGRLARDLSVKGKGVGELLLKHALEKTIEISELAGIYAVEVDAKNESSARFYESFGFTRLKDHPDCLILPMKTLR